MKLIKLIGSELKSRVNRLISEDKIYTDHDNNYDYKVVKKVVKSLNRKGFEWVPGMIGEEMVRSYFELPIRFKF